MTDDAPARISGLADRIAALAHSMDEQSSFFAEARVDFGIRNLRQGSMLATARAKSALKAGPRQMRSIEKTVLCELMRGAIIAAKVIEEAGSEAWPDLETAAAGAFGALRATAARDASLLSPPDSTLPPADGRLVAAGFDEPAGWSMLPGEGVVAYASNGIMLSAVRVPGGDGWIGRVGGVGVAICGRASDAASEALRVYGMVFPHGG